MSLLRIYYVQCDGCRRVIGNGERTGENARKTLRRNGWKRKTGSASAGRDYCPSCAKTQLDID